MQKGNTCNLLSPLLFSSSRYIILCFVAEYVAWVRPLHYRAALQWLRVIQSSTGQRYNLKNLDRGNLDWVYQTNVGQTHAGLAM